MKNIVIIAPSNLPIPSYKGGGIEQLIENLIRVNEKEEKVFFHIILSAINYDLEQTNNRFKFCKFYNVENKYSFKFFNLAYRLKGRFLGTPFTHKLLIEMRKLISKIDFFKVLVFGNDQQIYEFSKVVKSDSLIYYQATLMFNNLDKFKFCSKILLGSNHSINSINEKTNGIYADKIFRIQSCVDIDFFKNDFSSDEISKIKTKLAFKEDLPIVSYLGRVTKSKGIIVLLEACLLLKNRGVRFNLLIIGSLGSGFGLDSTTIDKIEKENILQLTEELGSRCVSTGFVNQEDLLSYMISSDIGVIPSIVEDVSPLSYFQWQAIGKPTIVSDAGGIPEFFSDDYSLMFKRGEEMVNDLAGHLEFLIKNRDVRIRMGQEALRMRPSLSKERYYNDLIDLLLS